MNKKTIGQQYHNCFIFKNHKRSYNLSREELTLNHIVLTDYSSPAPIQKKVRKIPFFMVQKKQKITTRPPSNIFTNKGIIQGMTTAEVSSERPYRRINSSNSNTQQTNRRSILDQITQVPFNFTRPKTARRQYSQTIQTEAKARLCTPNKTQNSLDRKSCPSEKPIYRRTISAWSRPSVQIDAKQQPHYFSAWETDPPQQEQYL